MKHLIDPTDITVEETDEIIHLALDIIANPKKYAEHCKGKKLATLFYEPSTRTRLSFTGAMMELGGNVLGFSEAASSSTAKGESVQDTAKTVSCFADLIAMRHFIEGAPFAASKVSGVPIINAGDGSHSHPTQTLTDLLTITRELGRLDNFTIGFCGDLKFGRTVHSLIKSLSTRSNVKVVLIAPQELRLPGYIRHDVCERLGVEYKEVSTMEEVMPELDILYMTRVQRERFSDLMEYERVKNVYTLTASMLKGCKPNMRVLHPLPRVTEIAQDVDDTPQAYYFEQARNGLYARQALICRALGL